MTRKKKKNNKDKNNKKRANPFVEDSLQTLLPQFLINRKHLICLTLSRKQK